MPPLPTAWHPPNPNPHSHGSAETRRQLPTKAHRKTLPPPRVVEWALGCAVSRPAPVKPHIDSAGRGYGKWQNQPCSATRLKDLGVPEYLLEATLIGVMAQTLENVSCSECGGKGCQACRGSGSLKRKLRYEILEPYPKPS